MLSGMIRLSVMYPQLLAPNSIGTTISASILSFRDVY